MFMLVFHADINRSILMLENLLVDQFPQSMHGTRIVFYCQFCISKSLLVRWRKAKCAGPMCLVSEVVKVAGEAKIESVAYQVNQIVVEVAIPTKWKRNITINWYKGKGYARHRGRKL